MEGESVELCERRFGLVGGAKLRVSDRPKMLLVDELIEDRMRERMEVFHRELRFLRRTQDQLEKHRRLASESSGWREERMAGASTTPLEFLRQELLKLPSACGEVFRPGRWPLGGKGWS